MREYSFVCPLPNGVHARPASALEETARAFASSISLVNLRTGHFGNARSVLAIVSLDIRRNDPCKVVIEGPDERKALDVLRAFLESEFPHCDDALVAVDASDVEAWLPPMLREAGARILSGTAVVAGIGEGRAASVGGFQVPDAIPRAGVSNVPAEIVRVHAGIDRLLEAFDARLEHATGVEAAVLKAQRSVARDPEFREQLHRAIREDHATAAGAAEAAEAHFAAILMVSGSALLRERALDIRDVCAQLVRVLYGDASGTPRVHLSVDSICVAENLTPGDFLALDRRYVKGLVLAHGATTSHTVILARAFGIPTVVGVTALDSAQLQGSQAIVDGDLGVLVTGITEGARRYYDMERRRLCDRGSRLQRFVGAPAITADGRRIEIGANIGTTGEAGTAFAGGAEGVGLFRTEMLFLGRDEPPSEEDQFDQYRRVLAEADGRPVIIRTLDVGGDKPIPYLRLPKEDNPFLGYRAVRLYPEFDAIFRAQIAALVRASAFGRLKVMVPMIAQAEEARWIRAVVSEEQAKCAQAGVAFDKTMPVGAMVEVPSLAFALETVCSCLDFFSIGTNDLLQYFMAVDRANRKVAPLYNPMHPAFLRLLAKIVGDAHAGGRWVGLCGEMGGQLQCLPLLVGLGLDEISMASPVVTSAKAKLASLQADACSTLLTEALACTTAAEVEQLVSRFGADRPAPLTEPDLVVIDSDGRSKEEAVKEIVDKLYVTERTDQPHQVQRAVWNREAEYSTGFGHGFAIPHCKTDAVRANSLAVLKLKTPVAWGSLDDKPVSVVLLLAIRESDQATAHMKVLASLSRKLMHEDFRERLLHEQNPAAICAFLRDSIF